MKTQPDKTTERSVLTAAVTFAQAALAGLDRRSGAGIAGCVT